MKKSFILFFFTFLFIAGAAKAQWTYEGVFPPANPDTVKGSTHGIAVDPDGKIWAADYFANEKITNASGDTLAVHSVKVYYPDGKEAEFSPIKTISVGPFVTDTLWGNIRGMRADNEGNILVVTSTPFMMYKFNYKDGSGMNSLNFASTPLGENSPTAPAVDEFGDIYVAPVISGLPLIMLDKDFNYIGNAIKSTIGFSRAFEISKDGNRIYWSGYTNGAIYIYERPNVFADYDSAATILEGFHAESFAWNPSDGNLYISAGSYNDVPTNGYTPGFWYAYDVKADAVVDSFSWRFTTLASPGERPRAIDFSPDGKTAYVGAFGVTSIPLIEKFHNNNLVSVKRSSSNLVENFSLSQNYPNPFNPSTNFKFEIPKESFVTLKIYDTLGGEVAEIFSGSMSAGIHEITFDASGMSSGIYFYTLKAGAFTATKKMTLLK